MSGEECHKRPSIGHHECEILPGKEHETLESELAWRKCQKNPGHENFFSVQDVNKNLPEAWSDDKIRQLRSLIDLTVRLRVDCTSRGRPDDDDIAEYRGTDRIRVGTGFIKFIYDDEYSHPCSCEKCDGAVMRKQWAFAVQTACHVVYNTEEAKRTRVDLFCDDASCQRDGRMKSV
ncbi:hypothetical protein ElyMa_005315800 [Elysia marginata]|uniref:Uncharacterized protein n=1 Tax=Elysia marginata TaxID=1093978 RepID=A0AAV4JYM6_9GAST|nr:hypothetical protein ElyMa_005315800 [Elysia marginata]